MNRILTIAPVLLALAIANPATAATRIYTAAADFAANTTATAVDSFDDVALDELDSPLARAAGSYGYAISAADGLYGAGSVVDGWVTSFDTDASIVIDGIDASVRAIGGYFFGTSASGAYRLGTLTVTLTTADGTFTETVVDAATTSFLGFVADGAIASLSISAPRGDGPTIWPTLNDLTLGRASAVTAAVPEPATWAMLLLGFAMLGATLRRRTLAPVAARA